MLIVRMEEISYIECDLSENPWEKSRNWQDNLLHVDF